MATNKDYYEILGVSKTASQDEIKSSYRRLCSIHHPDKHPEDKRKRQTGEIYDKIRPARHKKAAEGEEH